MNPNLLMNELAEALPAPASNPADDLARGRQRLARRRTAVAGISFAALAVIGGAALLPGTADTSSPPAAAPTSETPLAPMGSASPGRDLSHKATLQAWIGAAARHLDPAGDHLVDKVTSTGGSTTPTGDSLSTKIIWANAAGEAGSREAMVRLEVAQNRAAAESGWRCAHPDAGWTCETRKSAAGVRYQVAIGPDGTKQIAVERADGSVALVGTSPVFGNNGQDPLPGFGFSDEKLLALALDDALALPKGFELDIPGL